MRGLLKSKRVSWASDVNLCQVRLFLSEESPSRVGLGAQDLLEAKVSWPLHPEGIGSGENLPPGFDGAHPANLLKNKLSQIPLSNWSCPPRFLLDFTWRVVAGEESKEVEDQNQREMRLLEAVYPRASAIPPNPSVAMSIQDPQQNDQHTPLIPITPIEDEDAAADTSLDSTAVNSNPPALGILHESQYGGNYPNPAANGNPAAGMVHRVEPAVSGAAYTALTAVMTSNSEGNLIDPDLLVKILGNPNLIEKSLADQGAAIGLQNIFMPRSMGITFSDSSPVAINRTEAGAASLVTTPGGPFYQPPNRGGPVPTSQPTPPEVPTISSQPAGAPVAKDVNYYKSLIQQHGGDRPDGISQVGSHQNQQFGLSDESASNSIPRDSKPKIMKPCIYFNSSRGCRHGPNCSYLHDASTQQRIDGAAELPNAKKMKLDREIRGA